MAGEQRVEVVGGALIVESGEEVNVQEDVFLPGFVTPVPGAVLLARLGEGRRNEGLWELPGGKIEAGESMSEALQREWYEELGLAIQPGGYLGAGVSGKVRLHGLRCRLLDGVVGEQLTDHDRLAWVPMARLHEFACPDADKPLFEALLRWAAQQG